MANIIKPKRSSVAGKVPTTSDIVSGEIAINNADSKIYQNNGSSVVLVGAGKLVSLDDVTITTPSTGQTLAYNGTEWVNSSAGTGTVTSVGITPGTGVTVSNSPITTSGNITVGLSTKLTEIENLSGAGFITQNGSGVIAGRTIQAGTGISVAHGNGSSQDPVITNSGVTSITGTANQITASASTGGVTLSLPATINVNTSGNAATATTATNVTGSITTALSTKTTAYTATASDNTLLGNATSAAFSITLPTAVGITGKTYTVKKIDSSANALTVATTSSQTIDGTTTKPLARQYDAITVQSDGANWMIINQVFGRNGTAGSF